jgi:hypothetical protein
MASEPLHIFTMAGAVIGLGIFIHLFFRKNNLPAKLLALYTLFISCTLLEPLYSICSIEVVAFLQMGVAFSSLSLGPSLFLYCKHRLNKDKTFKYIDLLHFLPGLMMLLLMLTADKSNGSKEDAQEAIFYILFIFQLLSYTIRSLMLVIKNVLHNPSSKLKMQHMFLRYLVIISLTLFIYSPVSALFHFHEKDTFTLIIQMFLLVIIVIIALLNSETLENHKRETSMA